MALNPEATTNNEVKNNITPLIERPAIEILAAVRAGERAVTADEDSDRAD